MLSMETVEFHDIDENELRGLLHEIPIIWKKNSGIFDTGLSQIFRNIGELGNLIFGVHIYLHGNGTKLFIILTEYFKDSRIVTFSITATNTVGWLAPSPYAKGEIKFRTMMEKLTREELEVFSTKNQFRESLEIFVCPYCGAQYANRVLQITEYGNMICQNCNRLCNPL